MQHQHPRRIPFCAQSRGRRKAAFISVKNNIRRHAGILGGLFSTQDYLHGKNGSIDCFFLGSKQPVFYNCVIDTTRNAYKEQVRELAYGQSYALVCAGDLRLFDHAVKDPSSGLWAMTLPEEKRFDALDGLTRREWVERQIPGIANDGAIKVREGWTLHHDSARPLALLRAMADHAGFKLSPILQKVGVPASSPIPPPPEPPPEPSPQPTAAMPPVLTVISSDKPTPLSTESSVPSTLSWYLVHTKPRQEDIALANLQRQGYDCYLPQMRIERVRRRKAEVTTEPMFPRYLFIRLDSSDQGKSWSPIRSTLGVSQLVHFGARAAKVDDTLVDLLRQRERVLPTEAMFQTGDSVVIADGPFAGIEAIYQTADAERRAFILLEILAKPVSMHIDAGRLRKAG